jgi:hypothetical protein
MLKSNLNMFVTTIDGATFYMFFVDKNSNDLDFENIFLDVTKGLGLNNDKDIVKNMDKVIEEMKKFNFIYLKPDFINDFINYDGYLAKTSKYIIV